MEKTDLTHLIDRLDSMEDSAGASLNAISAYIGKRVRDVLCVSGEIVFTKPISMHREVRIKAVIYDSEGRVVDKTSEELGDPGIPFDAFSFSFHDLEDLSISKIRIYPIRRVISEDGYFEN